MQDTQDPGQSENCCVDPAPNAENNMHLLLSRQFVILQHSLTH